MRKRVKTPPRLDTTCSAATATNPGGISETAAMANVIKSIMGAGGFALPWAFAQTGTVFTTVYMILAAVQCLYCLRCMQRARDIVVEKDPKNIELTKSYAGLAIASIGPIGGNLTQLMVFVCIFGIAAAYLVFIASTLATIIPYTQNDLIMVITPVMVALSWLRSLAGVSIISIFGNVTVVLGMVAVLAYASQLGFNWAAIPVMNLASFPAAFGSVAFLFFVHFTMPPIESSMEEPSKFFDSSVKAFAISTVLSSVFGIIGAVCFGPAVSSVVITMMSGAPAAVVKLLLCVNLLCTFPIVAAGAFQIIENVMGGAENMAAPLIYGLRSLFVVAAATSAIAIPSFGKLLGLVGGVSCTALTLCFPPVMLLCTSKDIPFLEKLYLYATIIVGVLIAGGSIVS